MKGAGIVESVQNQFVVMGVPAKSVLANRMWRYIHMSLV